MGIIRTLLALVLAIVGAAVLFVAFLLAFVGFIVGASIIVVAFFIAVVGFLLILAAFALVFFAPYFQIILAAIIVAFIFLLKKKLKAKAPILEEDDGIEVYVEDPNAVYSEDEVEENTAEEEEGYTQLESSDFDGPYYVNDEIDEENTYITEEE